MSVCVWGEGGTKLYIDVRQQPLCSLSAFVQHGQKNKFRRQAFRGCVDLGHGPGDYVGGDYAGGDCVDGDYVGRITNTNAYKYVPRVDVLITSCSSGCGN